MAVFGTLRAAARTAEAGEIIFWFTSGLIEKHLDVISGGGGLFGPGWAMWADPILSKLALFVSDDASPLNPLADSMVAAGSTVVELQSAGPAADPADVMLRMILGSCDASELQGLDAIRKIGAKTKGVESVALIASEGTVTLIEICSGAVDCGAMAMDQRWGVGISGGSVERGNLTPDREALIYFGSPLGRAEPMPSWSKVRGDGAKGRQEPLGMPHRFKAFHRPFALSGGLMRVLGAIVEIPRLPVGHRRHELAVSNCSWPVCRSPARADHTAGP